MKALILVGGYGTRLRPLTFSCPKSILPFANKPMIQLQIQALAKVGCTQVILAINYQADKIVSGLKEIEQKYKIKIVCSKEPQAMGTAGPLKLAQKLIKDSNPQQLLFVFNSDIVCDYPLAQLLQFHKSHNRQGTIVLATVPDPSSFGVIVADQTGKIQRFVEKPKQFISNKINAGIYLLNTKVLNRIPQRFCMIQRQVFPQMAQEQELYCITLQKNFWNDVGQPKDYLIGQKNYLEYFKLTQQGEQFIGNVLIHPTAKVAKGARIGPNVVIGANSVVQEGARIKNATIFNNTIIKAHSYIQGSIISWECVIQNWARIQGLSVLAENVKVKQSVRVSQSSICSQKQIGNNVEKSIIM